MNSIKNAEFLHALMVLVAAAYVLLIFIALVLDKLSGASSAVALLLGGLALGSFWVFVWLLLRGEPVGIESHWGGIGGGVGGWRVTAPLVFLLLTLFFGGATAAVVAVDAAKPAAAPDSQKQQQG
ncbi:MAG: hypothetical protein ACMVY4_12010 [Minwuia sp.]|uniref:hypothetical protein n=1 Tax=Minwuia sp. TaxID=2493630 RepID=UPI003A886A9B